jgi:hypothetical protein
MGIEESNALLPTARNQPIQKLFHVPSKKD